jgi:hypothetical protein
VGSANAIATAAMAGRAKNESAVRNMIVPPLMLGMSGSITTVMSGHRALALTPFPIPSKAIAVPARRTSSLRLIKQG